MQELITFISHHLLLSIVLVLTVFLLIIVESLRGRRKVFELNAIQVTQMINHDHAVVIDLRDQADFRAGHIIDAIGLSPQEIAQTPQKIEKWKTRPLIFIGYTGLESQKMAAKMLKQGYNAYALAGGMRAWKEAQMPIVKND
jgi:rhodanese-related sulfurtransferase